MHDGVPIGVIHIRRTEVRPFTDQQIKLLETFADQAVIAIENARLIDEQQSRNRELTEALEQQTATSEVLRVIASSPTELQPVLDTLIANAVRLSGATKGMSGNSMASSIVSWPTMARLAEMIAILRANPLPASPELPAARAHVGGKTIHILDVQAESGVHLDLARQMGTRTMLAVPLLREGANIGSLTIWRDVVEPFTERQMELVKTFADQAVIAIENVRLFQELTEALEQQTATSQILGVIASSPTDIQPVLDTVIANAVRLVGAKQGHIRQVDGEFLRLAAHYNESDENVASFRARPVRVNSEGFVGRVLREKQPIHVPDVQAEAPDRYVMGRQTGARTMLAVPLLREGMGVGTISIWRDFVEPFTDRQIELVETFADQAVIAIENVRLFKELQERNRDLTEALEQQTATSEILSVISQFTHRLAAGI